MVKITNKPTVVLLDSHAMLHRSYHAFPNLTTPHGEPSGALFGLTQMLLHVMSEFDPHDVVACFDLPVDTFRHTAFDGYKAGRQKTDDALSIQIERARGIMEAWSIPVVDAPGFEADDCIGTLANKYHVAGYHVVIASGDRDTLQLVRDNDVVVWTLKQNIKESIVFNEEGVINYYGFVPQLIPDYKALAGDSSDNIPGIRGIGDKTARTLVGQVGSIDTIYDVLTTDPERIQTLIPKRMVELLKNGREEADFSRILGEIRLDAPVEIVAYDKAWRERASADAILSVCRTYSFTSLINRVRNLFSLQAITEQTPSLLDGLDSAHQSVDDVELRRMQIARWVIDPSRSNYTLSELYAWSGAATISGIWEALDKEIAHTQTEFVWNSIEDPLISIVASMREHGMLLDQATLSSIGDGVQESLHVVEKKIQDHAGVQFNINSPKQLGEILFETLNITGKGIKKNKSGGYSTQESELEKIRHLHPVIADILEYRGLAKLQSTYIESLPRFCDENSRIHPWLRQDGAATGRFSCTDPNIQNIPIRTELGKTLRNAFVAPPGYVIVRCDYSQIELRLAALLSGEDTMCKMFRNNDDIHTAVAARVFGVPESDVTRDQRRSAKVINFGILYGMGATALAGELGTIRSEAEEYLHAYYARFPRIQEYARDNIEHARNHGYTLTLFGRRRPVPEMSSGSPMVRAYGERIAMNAPIQGTAADVMKLGMIQADTVCQKYNAYMIAQVHDEVLFEVPESVVNEFVPDIEQTLESILSVYKPDVAALVPLVVETEVGPSWGQTKPYITS